jgi:hypothetical protein
MTELDIHSVEEFVGFFMAFDGCDDKWESSAQQLDADLDAAGYKIASKFYNEYILPDSAENLCLLYSELYILLNYTKEYKKVHNDTYLSLIVSDELEQELSNQKTLAMQKIQEHYEFIYGNNKQLQQIPVKDIQNKIDFIRGAMYGYPPENIKHWIENFPNNDMLNVAKNQKNLIKNSFGIDIGSMRLTVAQAEALILSLEQQKNLIDIKMLKEKIERKWAKLRKNIEEKSYLNRAIEKVYEIRNKNSCQQSLNPGKFPATKPDAHDSMRAEYIPSYVNGDSFILWLYETGRGGFD